MSNNTLFWLLPIADSCGNDDLEFAYLKVTKVTDEVLTEMLREMLKSLRYVKCERFEGFYDKNRMRLLINAAKNRLHNRKHPEALALLRSLDKYFEGIDFSKPNVQSVNVNGVNIHGGLMCYYAYQKGVNAIIDLQVLNGGDVRVVRRDGSTCDVCVVHCDSNSLHEWFVENRNPQRVYDVGYKKHSAVIKKGARGVNSAITYSEEKLSYSLKRAVGCDGHSDLYIKDNNMGKFIIFSDENLEIPTYHAHEVSSSDAGEIQKILKRGGQRFLDLINELSVTL